VVQLYRQGPILAPREPQLVALPNLKAGHAIEGLAGCFADVGGALDFFLFFHEEKTCRLGALLGANIKKGP
jgi:hypothetical protein